MTKDKTIKIAVVGASGYTGFELIRLLHFHPNLQITLLTNTQGGVNFSELYPSFKGVIDNKVMETNTDEISEQVDLAFLALPHKESAKIAKKLIANGTKVIDLSADYRLNQKNYEDNYCAHEDPANLAISAYGLPELFEDDIKKSPLIAAAGCYPTATILAIAPFLPYLDMSHAIFVDGKSGISGAGKNLKEINSFGHLNENAHAYSPITHRHAIEMEEKIDILSGKNCSVLFVPHVLPLFRGTVVSIFAKLKDDINPQECMRKFYAQANFIRIRETPPEIKNVTTTHFCDLFATKKGDNLFISSAIDNLARGTASNAIECANLMFDLQKGAGLPTVVPSP